MDTFQLQPLPLPPRNGIQTWQQSSGRMSGSDTDEHSLLNSHRREEWIRDCSGESALHVLKSQPNNVRGKRLTATTSDMKLVEKANIQRQGIIWPWNRFYRIWWYLTAAGAVVTVFLAPYQIAFHETPDEELHIGVLEQALNVLFAIDIIINFNLAFYKDEKIIYERRVIATHYFQGMFWVDFVGVFPFERVAFSCARILGTFNETLFLKCAPLRLFRLARFHHIKKVWDELQYDASVSLLSFTLFRNFAAVVISCHFQGCCMYYLARVHNFDDETWLGPKIHGDSTSVRYVTSLYLAITTFCTVGYGDFSPVNPTEKIVGSFFMLVNIIIAAWIIGSITLLMMKGDDETKEYRDRLEVLNQYGSMHDFDQPLLDKLKDQLRLQFNNRDIADDQVLDEFPSAIRRKILRRLYKEHLVNTKLMKEVRPQFLDAFLTSCNIEIFSPGEEIVEKGSVLSDLFLLVGGIAETTNTTQPVDIFSIEEQPVKPPTNNVHHHSLKLEAGDFIGEIGFFTESPQIHSVICLTVCKTLTMPRSTYKLLAKEHPSSAGRILKNLLAKVESTSMQAQLPKPLAVIRAGSTFDDMNGGYQSLESHRQESLTAVKDLVKLHLQKNHDDQTTRLLFAASRGDTRTITIMCDHGFDPNNADYDNRTALMVASMKGNADVVKLLLHYNACPNKTDMHGSSALFEAAKNGHEDIVDFLSQHGASLCMSESQAASSLCNAVKDGDILLLKRLLKAGIDVNAADYDKRTATHIAAAEGNVAAIRVFAEYGADFTLTDRWGNTVENEARRTNAHQLIVMLDSQKDEQRSIS